MGKKIFFIGIALIFINNIAKGQDPQFTQFFASPMYLSPSFAGSTKGKRVTLNYRDQWPALPKSFVTYAFSYDHFIHTINSGLGVQFLREQAGAGNLSTTNLGLLYAYHIKLNHEWRIIPALGFYYTQQQLQFHKLTFGNELLNENPTRTEPRPREFVWDVDASASGLLLSEQYWVGLTIDHLLLPNQSLTGEESLLPIKYSLFGGMRIPIGSRYNRRSFESIFPAFHFRKQGLNYQMNLGVYWHKQPFMLGFWYRGIPVFRNYPSNDAIAILLGYSTEQFSFGYSYDVTVSELAGLSEGAHEISVIFKFGEYQTPREKWKMNPCPGL